MNGDIFMDENVYRTTMQKVTKIKKEFGDLTNFAILNTFESERHRMRMVSFVQQNNNDDDYSIHNIIYKKRTVTTLQIHSRRNSFTWLEDD